MKNNHSDVLAEDDTQLIPEVVATKAIDESKSEMLMSINDFIDAKSLEERYSTAQTDCSCMSDDPVEVTSDESQEDGDADSGAEEQDDDEDEHSETDEGDIATETYADMEVTARVDNEIEQHVTSASITHEMQSRTSLLETSRNALFRRYSKLTPCELEKQERKQVPKNSEIVLNTTVPAPIIQACESSSCQELLQWKDARIAELQAALDHMAEAMAIQQRDISAQRIYLSRQAEQLTKLSISLHQEKMALHVERERFQRVVATTKLPPQDQKPPIKPKNRAGINRRSTVAVVDHISTASDQNIGGGDNRTNSATQLRLNPLVIDPPTRSVSLSALERHPVTESKPIAVTPEKATQQVSPRRFLSPSKSKRNQLMIDINLNDGTSTTPSAQTPGPESIRRMEKSESTASVSSVDHKKQSGNMSISDRFRSIRWRG